MRLKRRTLSVSGSGDVSCERRGAPPHVPSATVRIAKHRIQPPLVSSTKHRHTILLEYCVVRDNGVPAHKRLSNEQPVKRIPMVPRQPSDTKCSRQLNSSFFESGAPNDFRDPNLRWLTERELAQRLFDCNLPGRDGTHENVVCPVFERLPGFFSKAARLRRCPKQDMGIKQELQVDSPSNTAAMSDGSLSKSSWMRACPTKSPRRLRRVAT